MDCRIYELSWSCYSSMVGHEPRQDEDIRGKVEMWIDQIRSIGKQAGRHWSIIQAESTTFSTVWRSTMVHGAMVTTRDLRHSFPDGRCSRWPCLAVDSHGQPSAMSSGIVRMLRIEGGQSKCREGNRLLAGRSLHGDSRGSTGDGFGVNRMQHGEAPSERLWWGKAWSSVLCLIELTGKWIVSSEVLAVRSSTHVRTRMCTID